MRLWVFFIYLVRWSLATSCGKDHYVKDEYKQIDSGLCSENGFQRILGTDSEQCEAVEVGSGQTPADGELPAGACETGISTGAAFCIIPDNICTTCPEGWFQTLAGSDRCDTCPEGTHQIGPLGSRSCEDCPKGYSQSETGKVNCAQCPVGQIQPNVGSDDCDICPVGTYQRGNLGIRRCEECPEGWFQDNNGETSCKGCDPGTFQNKIGQPHCDDCERGQYQDNSANIRCLACKAGTFSGTSKMSTCDDCPQGWFQMSSNGRSCALCPGGETTNGAASARCIACDSGNCAQCNGYGLKNDICAPCAVNEYSLDTNICKTCPGAWVAVEESVKCEQCSQEQEASESGICVDCQPGGFRERFEDGTYSDKCVGCEIGNYFGAAVPWTQERNSLQDQQNIIQPEEPSQANCYQTAIAYWRMYGGLPNTNNFMPIDLTTGHEFSTVPQGCIMIRNGGENYIFYNLATTGRDWPENDPNYRMINTVAMPVKDKCLDYAKDQFREIGQQEPSSIITIDDPNLPYGCWKPPANFIQAGSFRLSEKDAIWVQTDGYCPQPETLTKCENAAMEMEHRKLWDFINIYTDPTFGVYVYTGYVPGVSPEGCVIEQHSEYSRVMYLKFGVSLYGRSVPEPPCSEEWKCMCMVTADKEGTIEIIVQALQASDNIVVFNTNKAKEFSSVGGFDIITGPAPMGACHSCPAGYYNDGGIDCIGCSPGKFAGNSGQTKCDDCPFPEKSFWSSYDCQHPCPDPFDVDHWGESECKTCPIGKYSPCLADASYDDCKPTLDEECIACVAGKVRNELWKQYCENCPSGKIANQNKTECVGCSPGKYESAGACEDCSPGQFISPEEALYPINCDRCAQGQYQDQKGQQACKNCPKGKFSNSNGETECTLCPEGYYSDNVESIGCVACPSGESSTDGLNCKTCGSNTVEIDHKCQYCQSGTFFYFEGKSCKNCPMGWFADSAATSGAAQRPCTICPSGWAQDNEGIPLSYRGGVASDMTNDDYTTRDEAEAAATSLKRGVASYFKDGQIVWRVIETNKTIQQNSASQYTIYRTSSCFECDAGEVTNLFGDGSSFCLKCTTGEICQECSPGKYFSDDNTCADCPKGYISSQGSSICNTCPVGKREIEHILCEFCALGEQPGPLTGTNGDHTCVDCPAGYFGSTDGVCTACPRGFYQSYSRQQKCIICPDLETTDSPGQTASTFCKECGAAFTLVVDGICSTCPAGRITGSNGCEDCQPGKHRRASDTICSDCAIGKFSNSVLPCTKCEIGKYTDTPGQSECEVCHGSITAVTCSRCPAGKWGTPSISCEDCPKGYWSLAGSDEACSKCGTGRANSEVGQKICPACLPGKFAKDPGSVTCKECPLGRFQENELAGVCIECPIGTFQDILGSETCKKCHPGTYTERIASESLNDCKDCPVGYMEVAGVCNICPERSYQPLKKSTNCEACPDETISTRGSVSHEDCFPIEGMKSYVFGMKGDSKPPQSASKKCEIRPNLVMLCPGCSCDDDSRNGFWSGPICDECRRGFATTTCLAKCPAYDGTHDSTMCNGNGFCWYGKYGNGLCYCGSKHAIDSSGENVVVDVRLCPKGQICPNYGVKEQTQTNYRPLYYIMRYREFSVFVLQLNKYVPDRGHMWFKRFPPSIAYENTCLHCASAYSQDISTKVGFWNNDDDYEYFEDEKQALTGFHGENCQYQCGLCLNGGRCLHAPHPYRYSYTILDSFENARENVFIPQTICICSSLVFDSENMCCPNGFQPYIHYGLRNNPKPYTRFSRVPFITNIKNLKMPHWINKDILLERDEKYMTPYTEPDDGKIWVANNNRQWSVEEEDFVQVPYRDAGPYNKHTYYGVPKEMCRACPGLFGKGVRSGSNIIESEQEAEDKWWDNAMGASARKCNGIGVCDFYKRENEFKTDFFGNADSYKMFERGKVCSDPTSLQMYNLAAGRNVSPETLNELCAEKARNEGAGWYAVAAPYFGGLEEDMRTGIDDELIIYYNRNSAEESALAVNSKGVASFENGTSILWTVLDQNARKLPIPNSDSKFTIYSLGKSTCGVYNECSTYVDIPNFNIYKREYGRGDDRLSIQDGDTVDATFDRFDTCFTYTKDENVQTYGLYVTRDYEQGEDPFLGGLCPKGHFCTKHEGIAYKEACPPGYYQPDQGRTRTVQGNKCNELATLENGCKPNEATLIETDFVDQVCLRCRRNYWAPKGATTCTECPFGKVKKISSIFDIQTVMINMAYMTDGIYPWYYHPNEIGLELADCALVPPGMVHMPYLNEHMTYEKQDFLAVAQCPFGFSSRPGSFMYDGLQDMANVIKNSEVSVIGAPFIEFKQSWTFQLTGYGETCECNSRPEENLPMGILTEEQCAQALKDRGIVTMLPRYGPAGCYLLASTPLVGYYGKRAKFERPVRSIRYICRLGTPNEGLQSKFARSNCFRCPGNSMSGPISTTCTTCYANKIKIFAKTAIQKLIESSLVDIIEKNANGNDIGRDNQQNVCECTVSGCSCNKIAYRPQIQNYNLVYDKSANFEITYRFGEFGGDRPLEIADCYLMCQSYGVSSPMLITGVGISSPDMSQCYCSTAENTNDGEDDNAIWYIVEGTTQFKRNGITLPIETYSGKNPIGLLPSVDADNTSPGKDKCLEAGQAMMIAQGIRSGIPASIQEIKDPKYASGCFIMEVDRTYFIKWNENEALGRNIGDDKTVNLVKKLSLPDQSKCKAAVESWRNSAYPTVAFSENIQTDSSVSIPKGCSANLVFNNINDAPCKDSNHKITSKEECTQVSGSHTFEHTALMTATDSYIKFTDKTHCPVKHGAAAPRRTITTAQECRRAGELVSTGAIKFHTTKRYYNAWNAPCPSGRTITTVGECESATKEVFGATGFKTRGNYESTATDRPRGCGYSGASSSYDMHFNTHASSTAGTYPTDWGAYRGSICRGDGLLVPYGCGYSGNDIHWNPNKGTIDNYNAAPIQDHWGQTRGAICGGERQGLPYGCSFLQTKVVFWNPNVASNAILPDDWSSFCLKEIKPVWNTANEPRTTTHWDNLPISNVDGEGCVTDSSHGVETCVKKCINAMDCESVSVKTNSKECCFWTLRPKATTEDSIINKFGTDQHCGKDALGDYQHLTKEECDKYAIEKDSRNPNGVGRHSRTDFQYGCSYHGSYGYFWNELTTATGGRHQPVCIIRQAGGYSTQVKPCKDTGKGVINSAQECQDAGILLGYDSVFNTPEPLSIEFKWGNSEGEFSDCSQFINELGPYVGTNDGEWMVAPCFHGLQNGECPANIHELAYGKTACDWGKQLHEADPRWSLPFGCSRIAGAEWGTVFNPNKDSIKEGLILGENLELSGAICHNYLTPVNNAVWFDLTNVKQTLPSSIEYMEDINIRPLSDGCIVMSKEICKSLCDNDRQCKGVEIFTTGPDIGKCCFVKSWTEPSPGNINDYVEFYISEEILSWSFTAWEDQSLPLCSSCNPGSYTLNGKCRACEIGKFTSTVTAAATGECPGCAPGFFAKKRGSMICTGCPAGWHQNQPESDSCIKCTAGRAQKNIGSASCDICEAGTYSGVKAQACIGCGAGKYTDVEGSEICKTCDRGTFSSGVSQTVCKECPQGFETGSPTKCRKCGAGKYAIGKKTSSCTPCQVGKFADSIGRTTGCEQCSAGKYAGKTGSKSCKDCPGGTACNAQAPGTSCARGKYKEPNLWGNCLRCPLGQFTPSEGAIQGCQWCPGGQYTLGSGEENCIGCPSEGFSGLNLGISYRTWPHSLTAWNVWVPIERYTFVVAPFDGTFVIKSESNTRSRKTYISIWDVNGQSIGEESGYEQNEIKLRLKEGQRAKIRMKCQGKFFGGMNCYFDVDSRLFNYKENPRTSYCGAPDMIKNGNSISTDYSQPS